MGCGLTQFSFNFCFDDSMIALNNSEEIRLYDAQSGQERERIAKFSEETDIRAVRADEHSNRVISGEFSLTPKLAVANGQSLVLLDIRQNSEDKALTIDQCHQEDISSVDYNPLKNHTLLTSSYDQTIKIWDTRKPEFPQLVISDPDNQ